ncbi:hypothetical protein BDV95DRAFT_595591 [Massariosphaeria phaeospora]|uniref:Threonine/serine exporter-like N-terminal domain-containing protein n=1 Tax=Massariosphaeria phaeospora TaxID=100035 RepID=A0A7C8M6A4_9PLEO|nr:hypothetical protein BDV95DRAFT_595591 [Massariosphaeria phaeospora]
MESLGDLGDLSPDLVPSDDPLAAGRKRVGFSADTPPREPDFGPGQNHSDRSDVSHEELSEEIHRAFGRDYVPKPRPAIRKSARTPPRFLLGDEAEVDDTRKKSGIAAQKRATRLAKSVGTYPAVPTPARRNSNDEISAGPLESIPLRNMGYKSSDGESADTEDDDDDAEGNSAMKEADGLIRKHTGRAVPINRPDDLYHTGPTPIQSGRTSPVNDVEMASEHVPRPSRFRTGFLGTLLRASTAAEVPQNVRNTKVDGHSRNPSNGSMRFSRASTATHTPNPSPPSSGTSTPRPDHGRHWYKRSANNSTSSLSRLVESASMLAAPAQAESGREIGESHRKRRDGMGKRSKSNSSIASAFSKISKPRDDQIRIKIHLAGTLARQNYLRKLCKALMMYGAPTHRLEEYMNMSARVLEIEAQFLYMPGCMIIAFDDSSVHTSEVKLVRTNQGIDLGKLRDVHEIYKDVVHDRIGVEDATPRLEAIIARKPKFNVWLRVLMYGLASATVGPFAFQARPIDLPICFMLGCFLGWLQLVITPKNELISNVFEIGAAIITSFTARGIGSIQFRGKELFCFSAIAQSSIALILPGFAVLSASLELQSKNIVAGSVRMVYAIIYSLFLGYGITIGTTLFGMMYKDATSETQCADPMNPRWYYFFVIAFSLCLMIINGAKFKQIPSMTVIALIGYVVNYHSSKFFQNNAQVSNTLGALAIGLTANLHARFGRHVENASLDIWESSLRPRWVQFRQRFLPNGAINLGRHTPRRSFSDSYIPHHRKIGYGLAAATMLPAIFVQVPSGLSVSGSLVSGITSADQITRNTTGITTVTAANTGASSLNSVALNVGFSVIQIAIGITVGLFMAALCIYPFGKRRSGLFSF